MSRIAALLIGVLAILSACCADAGDPPRLNVPTVSGGIIVDGELGEEVWKNAARIELSDPWKQTTRPLEPTEALVLNTEQSVYVAFLAQDREILANGVIHDTWVHKDDCVEVFFGGPWENLVDAIGFEINARGTCADYLYHHDGWFNRKWSPKGVRISVKQVEALPPVGTLSGPGYILEMEIPWDVIRSSLGLDKQPDRLRANFARWNYGGGRIFSVWSDSRSESPDPHVPNRYGWLIFSN